MSDLLTNLRTMIAVLESKLSKVPKTTPDYEATEYIVEAYKLCADEIERLKTELAEIKKEAETNQKWAFLEWRQRALHAESELSQLQIRLAAFEAAVEHVTIDGSTKRSISTSEGWAIVHKDRLLDLECAEEALESSNSEIEMLKAQNAMMQASRSAIIERLTIERNSLLEVIRNLKNVKGRYHTEVAYKRLMDLFDTIDNESIKVIDDISKAKEAVDSARKPS